MSVRDDLESELQDRLEDATLAIYADHLQSLGDPRGELIALDLGGVSPSASRRGEILAQWLGPDIRLWCDDADSIWYAGDPDHTWATFDRGLMDIVFLGEAELATDTLRSLLDSPAGPFLSRLFVRGDASVLRRAVGDLAVRSRAWLRDLAIHGLPFDDDAVLDDAACDALRAATPRLERLDISGRRMFRALAHPTVRELSLTGLEAIGLPDGPAMPEVRMIDLQLDPDAPPRAGALARLVARGRFPQLHQLRFGREEPGERFLFPLLDEIAVASQLTHLRLPALRSRADVARVQRTLDRLPALYALEIARAYTCFGNLGEELRHPTARIRLPTIWPWQPIDRDDDTRTLSIGDCTIGAAMLVELMEAHYPALAEAARDAWDTFWRGVADLGWQPRASYFSKIRFDARVLLTGVASLPIDEPALATLRDHLAAIDNGRVDVSWRAG